MIFGLDGRDIDPSFYAHFQVTVSHYQIFKPAPWQVLLYPITPALVLCIRFMLYFAYTTCLVPKPPTGAKRGSSLACFISSHLLSGREACNERDLEDHCFSVQRANRPDLLL